MNFLNDCLNLPSVFRTFCSMLFNLVMHVSEYHEGKKLDSFEQVPGTNF